MLYSMSMQRQSLRASRMGIGLGLSCLQMLSMAQPVAPPKPPAEPESLSEFLDSMAENALSADRSQLYRIDGKRRYVKLGGGWTAGLDEQAATRIDSTSGSAGTAGPPGRAIDLLQSGRQTRARLYALRDGSGRESGAIAAWEFAPGWSFGGQSISRREYDRGLGRHDSEATLRLGSADLWAEGLVRRAKLSDPQVRETWLDRGPSATFIGGRARWQALPDFALTAQAQRATSHALVGADERLAEARAEVGAEYKPAQSPVEGLRLYWNEALRLGLLASSGLEERHTYRRVLGADAPDGSTDGQVYAQLRHKSLLDEDDALLVVGWRHTFEPAPQWSLQTLVEQAQPLDGPNAVRSTTLGVRARQGAHPSHTLTMEAETVRSSLKNSAYVGAKMNRRVGANTVASWRVTLTDNDPLDDPTATQVSEAKVSAGFAWREPEYKLLSNLWRYTVAARNAHGAGVTTPGVADRRAHILFSEIALQATPAQNLSLRGSHRWDRDEAFQNATLRRTALGVARLSHDQTRRLSVSAHVAARKDSALPFERGYGAEVGLRLSRRVVLAVGYNPRGIDESELEIDDRLSKGLTLRLRFSVDAALARWLDPPWPLDRDLPR
jgi:hypothetical protein